MKIIQIHTLKPNAPKKPGKIATVNFSRLAAKSARFFLLCKYISEIKIQSFMESEGTADSWAVDLQQGHERIKVHWKKQSDSQAI